MKKALLLFFSMMMIAGLAADTELLNNGDFSGGDASWSLGAYEGAQAEAWADGGEMAIEIYDSGSVNWHVQFLQAPIRLQKNVEYTVTFEAKASAPRIITSNIGQGDAPYTSYSGEDLELTTEYQTFTRTFVMSGRTQNLRCEFNLGAHEGDVFLKNVSVVQHD